MKIGMKISFWAILFMQTAWAGLVSAEPLACKLTLAGGSRLWLKGDSTLHAYESEATVLNLDAQALVSAGNEGTDPFALAANGKTVSAVTNLVLTIPLKHMESGIIGLARQLRGTLKHKDHPNIVFKMRSYQVVADTEETPRYIVTLTGDVTLAGETKEIEVTAYGYPKTDYIQVTGEKTLRMTDFKVTPPSLMFGAIKTADEVTVEWDLMLVLQSAEETPE